MAALQHALEIVDGLLADDAPNLRAPCRDPAVAGRHRSDVSAATSSPLLIVPSFGRATGRGARSATLERIRERSERVAAAFEPREFIASGDHVVVDLHIAYNVKSTGKPVDEQQLQWWTLDAQHRVQRLLHFEDTAQVLTASR